MKYKALLLDLDGTTVATSTNNVSPLVIEKIHQAHLIVKVSIVTGRLLHQTMPILEQLDISGPCVIDNGAQVYDPMSKTMLKQLFLPNDKREQVYTTIKHVVPSFIAFDGTKEVSADEWKKLDNILSFFIPDASRSQIDQIVQKTKVIPDTTTNIMSKNTHEEQCVEVVHLNATKQFGVFELAKLLNISTHEIIGVGDSYNDFAMLMACGLKIAMGNAVQELKDVADFIAPSLEEDGVATVIDKFILNT